LEELDTFWSLDDCLRAEAVMDMFQYYEKLETDKVNEK